MILLFTGLILTGKSDVDYMEYHFYMGYALSSVILARFLYGIYGSRYALFKSFIRTPTHTIRYVKSLISGRPRAYLGHNPLGGLMSIILLMALSIQWISGLFNSDDIFWFGPFNALVSGETASQLAYIHKVLPDWLLGLVGVHIFGVLYHEVCFKERLVEAMIHGRKHHHKESVSDAKTPRLGVIFSLFMALIWLTALFLMPT